MKNKCHLRKTSKAVHKCQNKSWGIQFFLFFGRELNRSFSNTCILISLVAALLFARQSKRRHDTLLHFALVSQEIKWGQTHNTAMRRWWKESQQESTGRILGAMEAPLTNHSGKNACHFPTSGADSVGSQVCDLSSLQTQQKAQRKLPQIKFCRVCWRQNDGVPFVPRWLT